MLSVYVPVLGVVGRWNSSAKCACNSTWGWLVGGTVVLSLHVPVLGVVGRWHSSATFACTSTGNGW